MKYTYFNLTFSIKQIRLLCQTLCFMMYKTTTTLRKILNPPHLHNDYGHFLKFIALKLKV